MLPVEIKPDVYWLGVNDRTSDLFENLWPIKQEGISLNSYLVIDEKSALIDLSSELLVKDHVDHLAQLIDLSQLNYIVINHMEPDHSGALRIVRRLAPNAVILGSSKTKDMLSSFYGITENVQAVNDGEVISLGKHQLRFLSTPFLHWPETIMTYETTEKILFSCDAFGGFGALNGGIFDECAVNLGWYEEQALRYYSNILPTFSKPVKTAAAKLSQLEIKIVAPSHGLIWRKDPQRILELYLKWAGYAGAPADCGITLVFASIYGNTSRMMEAVAQGVADECVPLKIFNVSQTPFSYILPELWTKQGVLVGSPTYEGGLFPSMAALLNLASVKHITDRCAAHFGSYAWNGGAQKDFARLAEQLRWEICGDLEFAGGPDQETLRRGREFGAIFARKIKETTGQV